MTDEGTNMLTPQQIEWAEAQLNQPTTTLVEGTITRYVEMPDGSVRFVVEGDDTIAVSVAVPPITEDRQQQLDDEAAELDEAQRARAAELAQEEAQRLEEGRVADDARIVEIVERIMRGKSAEALAAAPGQVDKA